MEKYTQWMAREKKISKRCKITIKTCWKVNKKIHKEFHLDKNITTREFPGGPVVKTLAFTEEGMSSIPGLVGELRSWKPLDCPKSHQKKKKKDILSPNTMNSKQVKQNFMDNKENRKMHRGRVRM